MNLSTIELTREEAEAALTEWGEEIKARKCSPEDEAIAVGYAAIAKGKRLISLSDTLRAGGEDELHRPRLGVAPAMAQTIYLVRTRRGSVAFSVSDATWAMNRWDWDATVTATRVALRGLLDELPHEVQQDWRATRDLEGFGWRAMVPVVPPRFRRRGWKSCHVLFEAEWAKHTPPAPVDPALIQHLRGDLWIVRGVWDLTPLERAVLMERNRG